MMTILATSFVLTHSGKTVSGKEEVDLVRESTAKLPRARRVRPVTQVATSPGETHQMLSITVHLRDVELRDRLLNLLRDRRGKALLIALLKEELSAGLEDRDRTGLMQSQIPRSLKEAFEAKTRMKGLRRGK